MIPSEIIFINSVPNYPSCLFGFFCGNDKFITIYGVIFTIGISLAVYVYGIQDRSEKSALLDKTRIGQISIAGIVFFCLSFVLCSDIINYILIGTIIAGFIRTFIIVLDFNKDEYSKDSYIKDFKIKTIKNSLGIFFKESKEKARVNKYFDQDKYTRYVNEDDYQGYFLVRAERGGYVKILDPESFNFIITDIKTSDATIEGSDSNNRKYYIPFEISMGSQIAAGDILCGIQKIKSDFEPDGKIKNVIQKKVDHITKKIKSAFEITADSNNPIKYLERELEETFSQIFKLISDKNSLALEYKLKDFSEIINMVREDKESSEDILSNINSKIIIPIQDHAMKSDDLGIIRKATSFSLGYVYDAIDKKSISNFNLFMRNLTIAFYQSATLKNIDLKNNFIDVCFRWLTELSKYSIKPKLEKGDTSYSEYALALLSSTNGMLKIAFDNNDAELFTKTLYFLNNSFARESYEHDELATLDEIIKTKKAVIFGFTAWVYKYYSQRKGEDFYMTALKQLFSAIKKDQVRYYSDNPDDINYYLSIYIKASEISDKNLFSWESWGMPEGQVYTITIRHDIKNLLIDRLLEICIPDTSAAVTINEGNYNDELSHIKNGDQTFDPFINKTFESYFSSTSLSEEKFNSVKEKVYGIFALIATKYNENVRVKLIEQPIDVDKFNKFAKDNFDSYAKARVMFRVKNFTKKTTKEKEGFGYNMLLPKEQFVLKTNIHYTNDGQFGENLARSEDNKILETVYNKAKKRPKIKKEDVGKSIPKGTSHIVLWVNNYFNLEDTNRDKFRPHWQDQDSKKERGSYYQGSLDGVPVYIVYRFEEHKSYPDTLFTFSVGAFSMQEFELEIKNNNDADITKVYDGGDNSLHLSITNLSTLDDERKKIVEKWISDDPTQVIDKDTKIEELKTNVVFKFFKGIDASDIKTTNKITAYELE